jgi:uncharacterized protein (TIGR03790 family)
MVAVIMPISTEYLTVQHNITPDRVVFAYRQGDADSLEVAEYYRDVRGVPNNHLIALPCAADEVIAYEDYVSTIEEPLLTAISALDGGLGSSGEREIWVIILGYNVPVAYLTEDPYDPYYTTDTKAIASRLHRLGFTEEDQYANYLYDRRIFKYFDGEDAAGLYITAVINGPSKEAALALINRSIDVDNQQFVSGKVYVDPYGLDDTADQETYRDDILDFVSNGLSDLGLEWEVTVEPLGGGDPLVGYFRHDSFYWGWFTPRYTSSLFLNQNERRVFLYNADEDGASSITSTLGTQGSDPWCNIAINVTPGYACCAGAVDSPGEVNYLRPRPFFAALHQGAPIGEAFLYSSPVVDWRIILIGDPLMVVNFPVDIPSDEDPSYSLISNDEGIRLAKEAIEEALGYAMRQSRLAGDLLNFAYLREEVWEEADLLYPINQWRNYRSDQSQYSLFTSAVQALVRYIPLTTGLEFAAWLEAHGEKTTEFIQDLIAAGIPTTPITDDLIHEEGSWQYDFVYIHPRQRYENVFFELQVDTENSFSSPVVDVSSLTDNTGWKYEQETNQFVQLISEGFPSSFSGRRVRYEAPAVNYLLRTETYFIRWRSVDSLGSPIRNWTEDSRKLLIKR